MPRLIQISVEVSAEAAEAVSELFNRLNGRDWDADPADYHAGGGAVIEGVGFPEEADVEPEAVDMSLADRVVVKTFVPEGRVAEDLCQKIREGLWWLSRIHPMGEPELLTLEDRDWQEAWKEHYVTFRVGRRIVIQPVWDETAEAEGDLVIRLNPGMAFGTGLHPSTQLCLRLIESHAAGCRSLLDVGTGSGILAIAACRLGVPQVTATDIDPLALTVARENAGYNGIDSGDSGPLRLVHGSVPDRGCHDLVVVNILPHIIVEMLERQDLARRIAPGGRIVCAGIIRARSAEVAAALERQGCRVADWCESDDWVAIAADRP